MCLFQIVFDMVCMLVDYQTLAAKFHFEGEEKIFTRNYNGDLMGIPSILYLVEEVKYSDDLFLLHGCFPKKL